MQNLIGSWPAAISPYRCCTNCVMDTTDPEIQFNDDGVCSHCVRVHSKIGRTWFPSEDGVEKGRDLLAQVRQANTRPNRDFDSILGLSGGIDSAVVAQRALDAGLHPLAVHVDGGWNTESSVANVRSIVAGLGLTLATVVIDWEEMRNVQLAFLRSGTLNQDIPQDHAFFVSLYRVAIRERIPTILSGINYATESIEPKAWGYSNNDGQHVKSIYAAHGGKRLRSFPIMSHQEFSRLGRRGLFRVVQPLNYGPYNPEAEQTVLASRFGWHPYREKHGESLFTTWFQNVFLLERYGIDKRRAYLSSRIISGLLDRDGALAQLSAPPMTPAEMTRLTATVSDKLRIDSQELTALMRIRHQSNHVFKTEFRRWLSP